MDSLYLCLPMPKSTSHKGQNGVVLIIGGSKTYHGAPVLAAKGAVRFCDLVYFASLKENNRLMMKMKGASANIIAVPKNKFSFALNHSDCILIGNGMDVSNKTRKAVERVLKSKKKCIIDAAALRVLPLKLLHKKVILTPHIGEFKSAFGIAANEKNAKKMSKKHNCTILLKGRQDIVSSQGKLVKIKGGNAGMTKGGTGDVLAGLCAALFSRCDNPMKAAYTASLINKKAGERCHHKYKHSFSSEDLAEELAAAAKGLY